MCDVWEISGNVRLREALEEMKENENAPLGMMVGAWAFVGFISLCVLGYNVCVYLTR